MQSNIQDQEPWTPFDTQAEGAATLAAPRPQGTSSILLVEDDLALAEGLKLRLEHAGLVVTTVSTAAAARWDLLSAPFGAVLLDLGLPDEHGLDLLEQVSSWIDPPPFVVLTGADATNCDLALALGATQVLQKPCPGWLLTKAVLEAIAR